MALIEHFPETVAHIAGAVALMLNGPFRKLAETFERRPVLGLPALVVGHGGGLILRDRGRVGKSAGNSGRFLLESRGSWQSCSHLFIVVLLICHLRRTFGDMLGWIRS